MSREEAIAILKSLYPSHVGVITDNTFKITKALRMAIEALKIDLVRCHGCRFFKREECRYYIAHGIRRKPNDFCSYGKHRCDEDE